VTVTALIQTPRELTTPSARRADRDGNQVIPDGRVDVSPHDASFGRPAV